ncbi:MAG: hypothetical protein ABWY33_09140 [Cellulomonas sp.]
MRVLFDGDVHVHYGYLAVEPDDGPAEILGRSRAGQRNGLCGAAVAGRLSMVTGLHTGSVPVRVESHEAAPPVDDEWEDVVEASVVLTDGPYLLTAFDVAEDLEVPTAGPYRARWCASGMDAGHDMDTAVREGEAPDSYLLQLWPASILPDVVLRQGSAQAAYWHDVAAGTPPPPPGPTAADLERVAREQPRQRRIDSHARRAQEEVALWGGRPPSARVRSLGWRAAMLARQDRDLVDEIAALTPGQQRAAATWAATRACELAGVQDHELVREALDLVARGERLPSVWEDWDAVWDDFVPPEPGELVTLVATASIHDNGQAPLRRPLASEAAAIDAVIGASKRRPGRAAVAAIAGLSAGADDLPQCFADVRAALRTLSPT